MMIEGAFLVLFFFILSTGLNRQMMECTGRADDVEEKNKIVHA